MIQFFALGNRPVNQFKRETMDAEKVLPAARIRRIDLPVPCIGDRFSPQPTPPQFGAERWNGAVFIDTSPKSLLKRRWRVDAQILSSSQHRMPGIASIEALESFRWRTNHPIFTSLGIINSRGSFVSSVTSKR